MSLLAGANVAQNAEKQTDRLGGFQLLDTDVHLMNIEVAYMHAATSGARAVVFHFKNDSGSLRSTQYYMSGTEKGNKTYFEKDGKQYNLPGFDICDNIFKAAGIESGFDGVTLEEKIIKLYSKDANAEVPTKVQMITNILGNTVGLGVFKQTVDKTALGGDNLYHPTGETRDENEVNCIFYPNGLTIPETEAGITEPSHIIAWKEKYAGKVQMKAKGAAQAGNAGAPKTAGQPKKLFK